MTKWRLIIDEPPWIRLFDESDRVVATCLPGEPVSALIDHLSPGDRIDVCVDVPVSTHECADSFLRVWRMRLALLDQNTTAYDEVLAELGRCPHCLRNAMNTAVNLHTNDYSMKAGSVAKAADLTLKQIARETTG
jgi:hypothetical protein